MKSKTKTIKKVLGLALSLSICASFIPGALTANAEGETVTSDYTITIPATLDVANSGWNAIGDISATGTLASGKKLTVTAESANNWALVSGQNSVSYTLCNSTMSLEKGDAATSWDFTELNNEPNRKFIGIDVDDYSEKPAGTYTDTVTFTASVENAFISVTSVKLNKESTTIVIGKNETLTANVLPDDATDKTVTWESSQPSIATVDQNGKVTAVAEGIATITAKAGEQQAQCTVTTKKPAKISDAFVNGAVVNVGFKLANDYTVAVVTGTFNGNVYDNVSQHTDISLPDPNCSLTKDGNSLKATYSNNFGSMTITFNAANDTYTFTGGTGSGMFYPKNFEYISVNGERVDVTKAN